ncbi:MAG: ATP-binding protein [Clostridiales bacterium]|nr:ATP-binding protein [Clostridiales bacterium]
MTFDKKILGSVLKEMRARRLDYENRAALRREKIYEEIPRIAEIDIELKTTALDIIKSAFNTKSDAAPMLRAVREKNLALQAERSELLVAAGYTFDYLDTHYDCMNCEDTGYLGDSPCACLVGQYSKAQSKELDKVFPVGRESFDSVSLDYYSKEKAEGHDISPYEQMEEVYNYCVDYSEHFGKASDNLFMTGGSGLGKTLLACCVARVCAEKGVYVIYDTAFKILSSFEEDKFSRDIDSGDDSVSRYQECELLVIDDLGCEMITSYTTAALYHLINYRLLTGKKTIIISTLTLGEIRRKYNEQLYSRISGEYLTLKFLGEDIREKRKFEFK